MNKNNTSPLENLLRNLPQTHAELPSTFNETLMKRILAAEEKRKIRRERIGILLTAAASIVILLLALLALLKIGINTPEIKLPQIDQSALAFYTYIGLLVLILLGIDHLICKRYRKRHS